ETALLTKVEHDRLFGQSVSHQLFSSDGKRCTVGGCRRRRSATAKSAGGSRNLPSLNDQVLALATGKTQQEITAACKRARPNQAGAGLDRHKRAGRVEERDGKRYATQPTGTEQRVAV